MGEATSASPAITVRRGSLSGRQLVYQPLVERKRFGGLAHPTSEACRIELSLIYVGSRSHGRRVEFDTMKAKALV